MKYQEELVQRLALRRKEKLGGLSKQAYEELVLAVKKDPEAFVDCDKDKAYKCIGDALLADDMSREGEEYMDDASYEIAHDKRISRLRDTCQAALKLDADCLDAKLLLALTSSAQAYEVLAELEALDREINASNTMRALSENDELGGADAYGRRQSLLRFVSALARTEVECTCYSRARKTCEELIDFDQEDTLGGRYTLAIVLARLEDEEAFNKLDARFAHHGNAWSHLARTILMYKANNLTAAKRALRGYSNLCRGGAYALLRPVFVEAYLPDRPMFEPGSFEEAVLAVHECDPVIMDTPDFLNWALDQDEFSEAAGKFAEDNDLDW